MKTKRKVNMETSLQSPGYNVRGPRPWTSFKDTPPSPLLVLRKREGAKYPAPPAPVSSQPHQGTELSQRRSSKKRAPAPPVRSTSLKDSENEEDIEKNINVSNIEASPKVTIDLEEVTDSSQSYKNEVSIFVFPENETKELENNLCGEDSRDGVDGQEIILDVTKLQNSLNDAMETFGDAVNEMKDERNNVEFNALIENEKKEISHEKELTNHQNLVTSSREIGRRLAIAGWENFVEGILSIVLG